MVKQLHSPAYSETAFVNALLPKVSVQWSKQDESDLRGLYGEDFRSREDIQQIEKQLKTHFCEHLYRDQPDHIRNYLYTHRLSSVSEDTPLLFNLDTGRTLKGENALGKLTQKYDVSIMDIAIGDTGVKLAPENESLMLKGKPHFNAQITYTIEHESWHQIHADIFENELSAELFSSLFVDKLYTQVMKDFTTDYYESLLRTSEINASAFLKEALATHNNDVFSDPQYHKLQYYLHDLTPNHPGYQKYDNLFIDLQLLYDGEREALLECTEGIPADFRQSIENKLPESFADFLHLAHPEFKNIDPDLHPFELLIDDIETHFLPDKNPHLFPADIKTGISLIEYATTIEVAKGSVLKNPSGLLPFYSTLTSLSEEANLNDTLSSIAKRIPKEKQAENLKRIINRQSEGKTDNILEYALTHFEDSKNATNTVMSHLSEYIAEFSGRDQLKDPEKFQLCLPFASQLREKMIAKLESVTQQRANALGIQLHHNPQEPAKPNLSEPATIASEPVLVKLLPSLTEQEVRGRS